MTNEVVRMKSDVSKVKDDTGTYPVNKIGKQEEVDYLQAAAAFNPFFNFRYAYIEISSQNGTTYVKTKETRFENGKLVSEECEGSLNHDVVHNMLIDAQRQVIDQMMSWMKPFFAFLPFRPMNRTDRE
jgi:hypothetical protein